MKQALIKKGQIQVAEVPAPIVSEGSLLIKVVNSCISAGTEMSGIQNSGKSLIRKALEQPENIKKALHMARAEGIASTISKIKNKTENPSPTGYSLSGVVIGTGKDCTKFKTGDYVAAAGAGIANHAEYVDVPENLAVKMPDGLDFVKASTVTLGAIAMQSVRRTDLRTGEFCVVFGTGILGLLSVQILRHSGIRVISVDIDEKRLELSCKYGAETGINALKGNPVKTVENFTGGYGADAVLFTAATKKSEPLSQCFNMCRKKGRVILVGVSGMEINRQDMYEKELDFLISTSYGPGRYDKNYEHKGCDYPYAYVRWTETRNMAEYLRLLNSGSVNLEDMLNKIYPIEKADEAFSSLENTADKPLMVILDYGKPEPEKLENYRLHERKLAIAPYKKKNGIISTALIGAGNFATGVHLPSLEKLKDTYELTAIADKAGHKAKSLGQQYNAHYVTTNHQDILADKNIDLVMLCTQHDTHAGLALESLKAGKNVFVEKPLATNKEELQPIKDFYYKDTAENKPLIMVGFNRRFSPYAQEIKKHTDTRINPLFIHYRMNAGCLPADHWVYGCGGRIIGEACHIIDLATYLTDAEIISAGCESLSPKTEKFKEEDNKSVILKYSDGSMATIEYFAVGSEQFPKEYMEVHFDGKTIILNDYKSLKGYGVNIKEITTSKAEKGHKEELEALANTLKTGGEWPISLHQLLQTTEITFQLA